MTGVAYLGLLALLCALPRIHRWHKRRRDQVTDNLLNKSVFFGRKREFIPNSELDNAARTGMFSVPYGQTDKKGVYK
jgi:hypothetical protein